LGRRGSGQNDALARARPPPTPAGTLVGAPAPRTRHGPVRRKADGAHAAADMIDRNDIVPSCGEFAAHAFRKSALDLDFETPTEDARRIGYRLANRKLGEVNIRYRCAERKGLRADTPTGAANASGTNLMSPKEDVQYCSNFRSIDFL